MIKFSLKDRSDLFEDIGLDKLRDLSRYFNAVIISSIGIYVYILLTRLNSSFNIWSVIISIVMIFLCGMQYIILSSLSKSISIQQDKKK